MKIVQYSGRNEDVLTNASEQHGLADGKVDELKDALSEVCECSC